MPEAQVWQALADALADGSPCALVAVADSHGSSPGRRGALMAVGPGGRLAGTVGGGVAEADLVDRVADGLRSGSLRPSLIRLAHREGVPQASGLICGGSQVLVASPLGAGDLEGVTQVAEALAAGLGVPWRLGAAGWTLDGAGAVGDGRAGRGEPGGLAAADRDPHAAGLSRDGERWVFRHRSGPTHVVQIIGAGHVGAALAPLLMDLDFRVVLVDERPGIDLLAIPAHQRIVVAYEDLAGAIDAGPTSFVSIMSHAHDRDGAALAAVEGVPVGYLGLLGSRAKVRRIVGDRHLPHSFHGPIGLPIGSTTPAEIAVSIAAEMIAVRSRANC